MTVAAAAMDPVLKALLFGAAVALFALAAVGYQHPRVSLVAAGLAVFSFPWFWDALAQT